MTLAAEFTNASKRQGATLTINRIANGRREFIAEHPVSDKRAARKLAAELDAKPWNF